MMTQRWTARWIGAGAALGLSSLLFAAIQEPAVVAVVAPPAANPAIEESALRQHLEYLASDELKGRAAFSPETHIVAAYLATALKNAGVQPAADGSYLQNAPFVLPKFEQEPELVLETDSGERHTLAYGTQFRLGRGRNLANLENTHVLHVSEDSEWKAEPASDVVVLFTGAARAWRDFRDEQETRGWGLLLHRQPGRKEKKAVALPRSRPEMGWRDGDKPKDQSVPAVSVYGDVDSWIGSVSKVHFTPHYVREEILEPNVVGILPGQGTQANPDLADEVIVLSAHFDHVGVNPRAKEGEDAIMNGADDDGSGVVVLLELAEALAAGEAPARTVVFLFACAEEKGMLGTEYFVDHPVVPFERIVCNLNLEMLGRPDPLVGGAGKLWLSGFERSSLGPAFADAGIPVVADQRLEQNFFGRSDNVVFVRKGVVGQTLSSYNMHKDYHRVTDEVERIDFAHLTQCAEGALSAARLLIDGTIRPTWNEGEPKGY